MGRIWIKNFTGGLDTTRLPEAALGGVLAVGNNGHINRGGEFEQRAAFVPVYDLPAGTVGMYFGDAGIVVFGDAAAPALPNGVSYQRLQHPNPPHTLVRILSADRYNGKIYAVAEFDDGSVWHYYDGTIVPDFVDGRARAALTVTGGSIVPAVSATGSFVVTGGTLVAGNEFSSVLVNGINILGAAVPHTGNNATTAAAIAAQINSFSSAPEYTAVAAGATVTITAAVLGPAPNGFVVLPVVAGNATFGSVANMAGGAAATVSTITDIKVNGVSVISAPVQWAGSNSATAQAIAGAINTFISSPNYRATAVGAVVNIISATAGTGPNGFAVAVTSINGLTTTPVTPLLAGGSAPASTYTSGSFVKTVGTKEYSVSGQNLHFSGVDNPVGWTTAVTGAGFISMAKHAGDADSLTALATYQNLIAIFAPRVVLTFYVDPDPTLNKKNQVLQNTGTVSPKSVTPFGDTDLFYLDESGCRSLRARDASNAAATTDIGVPVDDLIVAKMRSLTYQERANVIGAIEPSAGRFWLIMKDEIFVFSFFNGAKVSAWSTYTPSYYTNPNDLGSLVKFNIDDAVAFQRKLYVRSGDKIFVYGGLGDEPTHDATVAEAWLPYLDANDPTRKKHFNGIDLAMRGLWEVAAACDPNDQTVEDRVGRFERTTYHIDGKNSYEHEATHIQLRFRSVGVGPHRLASCCILYAGDDAQD